jgi:hypothetical protein
MLNYNNMFQPGQTIRIVGHITPCLVIQRVIGSENEGWTIMAMDSNGRRYCIGPEDVTFAS